MSDKDSFSAKPAPALSTQGARIAHARKQARLSQQNLADRLGVTQGAVTQWEQGQTVPRPGLLTPLSQALGVSVDWLLTGGEPEERPSQRLGPAPGLSSLQLAALDAFEQALVRGLVSNQQCLAWLTEWQTLLDKAE